MLLAICGLLSIKILRGALFGAMLNPTITQCTCALLLASLSHLNVRCAKSICTPSSNNGFHKSATLSPYVTEFVDTSAALTAVPFIRSAAFLYLPTAYIVQISNTIPTRKYSVYVTFLSLAHKARPHKRRITHNIVKLIFGYNRLPVNAQRVALGYLGIRL